VPSRRSCGTLATPATRCGTSSARTVLINVEDVALGHETRMRWNPEAAWIWSPCPVHEPLITREMFDDARRVLHVGTRVAAQRGPRAGPRTYLLRGLLTCATCGRRMEGSWNNGRAHYRCKVPNGEAGCVVTSHPPTIYVREDKIVRALDGWLSHAFDPEHVDTTIDALHRAGEDQVTAAHRRTVQAAIQHCNDRLGKYRAALDAGVDVTVVGRWIAEVEAERVRHEIELARLGGQQRMTRAQLADLVRQLGDIVSVLQHADPDDRAEVYRQLNLRLTYDHAKHRVAAEALPAIPCTYQRVRGGT
jgi:site-specific DNA recombinase